VVAVGSAGNASLEGVVGVANDPEPVFMPASGSLAPEPVAPLPTNDSLNVWYNASAAVFPPFSFISWGTYAPLTVVTPRGNFSISVTTGYYVDLTTCDSDYNCNCEFNGSPAPSCSAYFTLAAICLVVNPRTGVPAVGSEVGAGCAPAATDDPDQAYPSNNPCLPPWVDGLSPFAYNVAFTRPTGLINLDALPITLRASTDPWVYAMHATGGSANFGANAAAEYVEAVALWCGFGVSLTAGAFLLSCMSARLCDPLLSQARLDAWRARLSSRRLHPNIGRTFRHRGAGGGDVPHDALVAELLAAPRPPLVPAAEWDAAGPEEREVLVADALEADPMWRRRDAVPCSRTPICCLRAAMCGYACFLNQRDLMRGCATAFSLRIQYKTCTRALLLFLALGTFIVLLTLLLVWPLGDDFVCKYLPTCDGALTSTTCAHLSTLASNSRALATAYHLQLSAVGLVVGALLVPLLLLPLAACTRWRLATSVAVGASLYAVVVVIQIAAIVHYYLGGIESAAIAAFCDTSSAYAFATCRVTVDMELASGLIAALAVANTLVYSLALTAVTPGTGTAVAVAAAAARRGRRP